MIAARLLLVAALVACGSVHAQNKPCSKADGVNAEKAIERASSWTQLAKAYKDWRHCDGNAAVADLYSESLVRLIVEWKKMLKRALDEAAALPAQASDNPATPKK